MPGLGVSCGGDWPFIRYVAHDQMSDVLAEYQNEFGWHCRDLPLLSHASHRRLQCNCPIRTGVAERVGMQQAFESGAIGQPDGDVSQMPRLSWAESRLADVGGKPRARLLAGPSSEQPCDGRGENSY